MENKLQIKSRFKCFFNLYVLIISLVIWIVTLFFHRYYFINPYDITPSRILSKIVEFIFIYLIAFRIYTMIKERRENKLQIIYAAIYFCVMFILILLIWPGAWSWDDIGILNNASIYKLTPWQHFFSGLWQIICLQILPFGTGVIIVQSFVAALIVGFCVSRISKVLGKTKKQVIILSIILFLIMLFPPLVTYIMTGYRMGIYPYLELLLVTKIILAFKEGKKLSILELFTICFLTVVIGSWRSEAIYLPVAVFVIMLCMRKEIVSKLKTVILFAVSMVLVLGVGAINTKIIKNNNYSITATIEPVVTLVRVADESDAEELRKIDRVIDVNKVLSTPDASGEYLFWRGVVRNYTKQEFSDYIKAYIKLFFKYPKPALKAMWDMFVETASGTLYKDGVTARTVANTGALDIFTSGRSYDSWQKVRGGFTNAINEDVRRSVIEFLCGIEGSVVNITPIYNVFWNLFVPICLLLLCMIYKLIKLDWKILIIGLSIFARVPLIFATECAPYFMYYLSFYICSYFLSTIIIFELIMDIIGKVNKKKGLANITIQTGVENAMVVEEKDSIEEKSVIAENKKDKILIFVPMYNCEKQITRVLEKITDEMFNLIDEVIIIDNISTDDSLKVAKQYIDKRKAGKFTLIQNKENYSLGGSHKVAIKYAKKNGFDYLIVLHGDDQADINDILPYIKSGEYKNYDCMLGSRFMKGSTHPGYSKFRVFGNIVMNKIFSLNVHKSVKDMGAGLNLYNINCFKDDFQIRCNDSLTFNCDLLMNQIYLKQNIKFFPISWREEDQKSNAKVFKQARIVYVNTLKYMFGKKKFFESDHRTNASVTYEYKIIN